jgi:hypothetical protein
MPAIRCFHRTAAQRGTGTQAPDITDKSGVFGISDFAAGKYTLRVAAHGFLNSELLNIRVGDCEDHHLRRILREAGEAFGNCVVRINATSHVQRTGRADIELSGRVLIRRGERAGVSLVIFTDTEAKRVDSTSSDNKGRFRTVVPFAGMCGSRSKSIVALERLSSRSSTWTWDGLSWVTESRFPESKLNTLGLGHFCY